MDSLSAAKKFVKGGPGVKKGRSFFGNQIMERKNVDPKEKLKGRLHEVQKVRGGAPRQAIVWPSENNGGKEGLSRRGGGKGSKKKGRGNATEEPQQNSTLL